MRLVAIKAGKHRFTAFREERDKTGDRVVENTKKARDRYFERVEDGTYYERR